ncbi:MAG TPA: Type 1 glutamine amidotransferase-like domain-containing protein [Phycisphaerales bacterium]|nr:Type 1 glutamine amidotransferase-like domain-containing protein [Phycisphaerales bacterium]HMP37384.1 Type 1 glutamine amidotransferase-like domain-containing protein [Phycisphaerales bacterium]
MPPTRLRVAILACLSLASALGAVPQSSLLARGYICAEGGGSVTGGSWAPGVFGWMVEHGGDGTVVILGVSGSDNNAANAFLAAGAASVTQLNVTAANANSPAVAATIAAADIVWMRGGDQANYVNWWNNTATEAAIRSVYLKGGVVGGTSAGCAVLGSVIYDAKVGSVSPKAALQNPYHPFITFTDTFLELVPGALFDTHFTERGRLGRLAVMIARRYADLGDDLLGIGVDDRTALCVYPDLTAEVRGEGAVTFIHRTPSSVQTLASGSAPVFTSVAHTQILEGYRYDLVERTVIERPAGSSVAPPAPADPVPGVNVPQLLAGSSLATAAIGEFRWLDFNDSLALFLGKLQVVAGTNVLGRSVLSAQVWNSTDFDENRVGGVQYAMALHPHLLGIYLDGGVQVQAESPAALRVLPPSTALESATVILDGHGMTSRAFSTYVSSANSVGPRQSVAIEGAILHLLRRDWGYRMAAHRPFSPAGPADIDLSGIVDGSDLGLLLNAWGSDAPEADLDGDGVVGGADLGLLLNAWMTP